MRINIKATQISLTPAISEYLNKRLSALEKFIDKNDQSVIGQVELAKTTNHHKSGEVFRAEINLHTKGKDFYVFAEHEDLYAAIDLMKDGVVEKVRSWKDKKISFIKRGGRKIKNIVRGLYGRGEE